MRVNAPEVLQPMWKYPGFSILVTSLFRHVQCYAT